MVNAAYRFSFTFSRHNYQGGCEPDDKVSVAHFPKLE